MARRTRTRSVRGRRTLRRGGAEDPEVVAMAVAALKDEVEIYKEEKAKNAPDALSGTVDAIASLTQTPELATAAKKVIPEVEADKGITDSADKSALIAAIKEKMTSGGRRSRSRRGGRRGEDSPALLRYMEEAEKRRARQEEEEAAAVAEEEEAPVRKPPPPMSARTLALRAAALPPVEPLGSVSNPSPTLRGPPPPPGAAAKRATAGRRRTRRRRGSRRA